MKLSCLPVSFFKEIIGGRMSVAEWAQIASSAGLDGMDLSILFVRDPSCAGVARLRNEIDDSGMRVVMITSYQDFTHPDPEIRSSMYDQARNTVDIAVELNARYLRVTAGQAHPQVSREAGIGCAVEGLSRLIETSQGSGIEFVFENHSKPMAWSYPDFSQAPDVFLEIVRQTAGLPLGINFDTANATAFTDDPLGLLNRVIDRVRTVHVADTAVRGKLEMAPIGTGIVPFDALFGRLRSAHFDGWFCIEEGSFTGAAGVETAAKFTRNKWDEVDVKGWVP